MPEPTTSRDILEDLILDIEEERCVLLIGPEIIEIDGKSQTRFVHEQVRELEAEHIDYYYPNDSLFLFKDETDKNRVARRVKRLYRNMELPIEVYRRILELPIPLIISLNPDTFLTETAVQLNLPHHFSHFRFSGGATEDVGAPTASRPLFYNLCGNRSEEETLILDYEDLFRLLRAILPDGLPNKIRLKLKEASSFLFLGFDFEKWYTQLLLQLLTGERKGRPKFALRSQMEDSSAQSFLIHQFQIQFLGSDHNFFDQLHETLGKEGLLRKLSLQDTSSPASLKDIRTLVAEGDLEQALARAGILPMNAAQHNTLLELQARLNKWKSEKGRDLSQPGQAEPIFNRIMTDFLDFLKDELQ